MSEIYLELLNINKKIDSFSLDHISYQFKQAHLYYLQGNNGSGKTTLFNIIAGFIFPDSGKVLFWGKTIKGNENFIKNKFAFIPNYVALPSHVTPKFLSNLYNSMYCSFNSNRFIEHLYKLKINDKNQPIGSMSDGMKKKVLIALELSYDPDILIADEICNNLDESAILYLFEQLENLRVQNKSLVIITSHDKRELMKYDPIIIDLKNGRIAGEFV